ncbi:hypothetical protein BC834DRAFT_864016 [Gloeopeniophorella convolvens]|nr:hypothetical protein BC834DRAFT_864016 [Gloeopeniophorella convolvens]
MFLFTGFFPYAGALVHVMLLAETVVIHPRTANLPKVGDTHCLDSRQRRAGESIPYYFTDQQVYYTQRLNPVINRCFTCITLPDILAASLVISSRSADIRRGPAYYYVLADPLSIDFCPTDSRHGSACPLVLRVCSGFRHLTQDGPQQRRRRHDSRIRG